MPTDLATLVVTFLAGMVAGSIPQRKLSDIGVAWLSKKLGVKPADIRAYDAATGDDEGG